MSRNRPDGLPPGRILSHLGVMVAVAAVLGVVVAGLAIPFAGVLGFTARNVAESVDELPQELETEQLPQRTEIKDASGDRIATLYDQNRVNVPLRQISRIMVQAIVAIEDYRFYQHGALDLKGTMRALFTNQAAGGVAQGGSSITQQLVKLTLVNQAKTDEERKAATAETYGRKLRELRYAIALEKRHDKDWILERYLNTAYFGDGAYGVQAAAQHYFSVNAKNLNLRQAALLAGLVQSPEAYNPTKFAAQAKVRRNVVLQRMAQLSVITDEDAARVKERKLGLKVQEQPNGCVNSAAQFFCDYVVRWLKTDPALGETAEERERLIFNGGLTIKTTIDLRFQRAAQRSVDSQVFQEDDAVGALALVEPGTGNVRGLAQSKPMGTKKNAGETFLNYTVPKAYGDANGFQAGSTFKAFVLAAAIDKGIPLNTTYASPSLKPFPENTFETCDGPYQSSNIWTPKNSTGDGTFDLYTGTRRSVNTFFVQLEQETGICEPWKLAKRIGVQVEKEDQRPSFTLGVTDVSPLEMAEAYATFAGRGVHCAARPVLQIEDADANVLKKYEKSCTQELPGPVADAVNDVLRGVVEPGGFGSALNPGQPAAGKTGTINDNKAVWFAGYTPNLAGAAVVAGANREGTQITLDGQSIGGYTRASTAGSTTAGPIWGGAFGEIAPFLDDAEFTRPSGTDIRGLLMTIPAVGGRSYDDAKRELEGLGFQVSRGDTVDSGYNRGLVAYSYPGTGDQRAAGDTITLYISDGTPKKPKKGKKRRGGRG